MYARFARPSPDHIACSGWISPTCPVSSYINAIKYLTGNAECEAFDPTSCPESALQFCDQYGVDACVLRDGMDSAYVPEQTRRVVSLLLQSVTYKGRFLDTTYQVVTNIQSGSAFPPPEGVVVAFANARSTSRAIVAVQNASGEWVVIDPGTPGVECTIKQSSENEYYVDASIGAVALDPPHTFIILKDDD